MQESQESTEQTAPALEPKPERPSEKQIRAMRRQFITIMHGTVRACGHKIDISKQPKNNCEFCWEAYFKTTDNLLVTLHEFLVTRGLPALRAQFGDKLVKQFSRFLDRELNVERVNAISEEGEGSACTEAGCGCAGVTAGEVQSSLGTVSGVGQEASNDEQPSATGEEAGLGDPSDQHGTAEPGL